VLPYLQPLAIDILRLALWLLLLTAIFATVERLWSLRPQNLLRKGFGLDVTYFFLSGLIPKLLLMLPLTWLAATLHYFAPSGLYDWVGTLPAWLRMFGALVVADIGSYWAHRWAHESPFLWRFHALHHSAEEIDWLVNTRAHPFDLMFIRLGGLVPMYALGLAQPTPNRLDWVPLIVTIIGTMWGFLIHANVRWRFGFLESVLSSPAFHHWHHTNDSPEHINKNYASMLPWVDRLFGTFYLPTTRWPDRYGVDQPTASTLSGQLLQPLESHRELAGGRSLGFASHGGPQREIG
jgi:sterol desaturase/sphingolipid hydroxylase (fatty acid hydroxylase superfamily)